MMTRLIGGTLLLALTGCASAQRASLSDPVRLDRELFPLVIAQLRADSIGGMWTIDPRPARPDPDIVTLYDVGVWPEKINPDARETMFADTSGVSGYRIATLRELGVQTADAMRYTKCPGYLMPATEAVRQRRKERCPDKSQKNIVVALPREGGVYWPNNRDDRADYAGRDVASVRIVEMQASQRGGNSAAYDLVFERDSKGKWQFLLLEPLLIVE